MSDLFEHFSTGRFGAKPDGTPVPVELIINGDFLDPLNVPVEGEFEDAVTEQLSLKKVRAILTAHARVSAAIRRFAALPGKTVTYLVGNHDADLFFPAVREEITRAWDPEGRYPSPKVRLEVEKDRLTYPEGVEIRHGNQLEAGSNLNFEKPVLTDFLDEPVLNLPWSSIYVLKILNRMKWEREYIDKIRPVKVYVFAGLLFDTWFTLRFVFLSLFYFLKTRFSFSPTKRATWKMTRDILKQESRLFLDLEEEARQILDERSDLKTIIFGHTHLPMNKLYADGKQYINTGTWTKMVNLDFRGIGGQVRRTFAFLHFFDGSVRCELRQWMGDHSPHALFDV